MLKCLRLPASSDLRRVLSLEAEFLRRSSKEDSVEEFAFVCRSSLPSPALGGLDAVPEVLGLLAASQSASLSLDAESDDDPDSAASSKAWFLLLAAARRPDMNTLGLAMGVCSSLRAEHRRLPPRPA